MFSYSPRPLEGPQSHFSLIVLLRLHWSVKIITERVLSDMPTLSTLSAQELKPGLRSVYRSLHSFMAVVVVMSVLQRL